MPPNLNEVDRRRLFAMLSFCLFFLGLGVYYLVSVSGPKYSAYWSATIRGRVAEITGFGRGLPTVRFHHQPKQWTLLGPDAFGKYLAVGDSVVKQGGTEDISIYRPQHTGFEATHWRYVQENGYQQIKTTKQHLPAKGTD